MFKDEADMHFEPGDQIAFAPLGEVTNLRQEIVQYGFVTSTHHNSDGTLTVFCRYWNKDRRTLRTTGGSEGADWYDLIHCSAVDTKQVLQTWVDYVSSDIIPLGIGWFDIAGTSVAPAVGVGATICYLDDLLPAVVSGVLIERRVSKGHGKIWRQPVEIELAKVTVEKLNIGHVRAGDAAPMYNHYLSREEMQLGLGKRPAKLRAVFAPKTNQWLLPSGATVQFGICRYRTKEK